jgi:hypothetical protein
MSIKVFGFRENPLKDRSTFHVSKSTRDKWLTLGTHVEIDRHTIQAIDPSKKRAIRHTVAYKSYIPVELPPDNIDKSLRMKFIPPPNVPRRRWLELSKEDLCLTPIYSES